MNKKERKLYKIGHLTKLLGITSRTIRYYDQFGLLPHVKRSEGNVRLFDEEDLELIKKIRHMQKEEFLPLEVIKDRLFNKSGSVNTPTETYVVTDSTATIPKEVKGKLPVTIIPLNILFGDQAYKDSIDLSPQEFWETTRKLNIRPKTSPPSVADFEKAYLELRQKGIKQIYSIHLSSTLSKTYENAVAASHLVSDKITVTVVDSRTAGSGLGLLVQIICEAIQKGDSAEEIRLLIAKQLPLIYTLVTVNNLQHLMTGGVLPDVNNYPMNKAQADIIAKIFDFKPVFQIKDGRGDIDIVEFSKDKKRAMELIIDLLEKEIESRGGYVNRIMILYNYLYGESLELINRIKNHYPNTPVYLEEDTGALSIYVGPETIAVSIA